MSCFWLRGTWWNGGLAASGCVFAGVRDAFLPECARLGKDVSGQEWIGDKGFVSKARVQWAKSLLGSTLHIRQRDYQGFTPAFQSLLDCLRRPIEGFLSVLTEGFHLSDMLVKTDIGIYRRVEAKVTAFNLARYCNLVLASAGARSIRGGPVCRLDRISKTRYEHSAEYTKQSIRGSLDRLGVEYVDLYQLHRPDPLTHPGESAAALDELVEQGLIRYVGVSNYYPHQVLALKRYLKAPIVANQIAISLLRLDPIYEGKAGGAGSVDSSGDGVLDQCLELGITPLAYSPVGGGWLSGRREVPPDHGRKAQIERTLTALREMGSAYGGATPTQLAVAWLLAPPAGIIPLVGSNNPEHIREAAGAGDIKLSRADWYKLWIAARGERVP